MVDIYNKSVGNDSVANVIVVLNRRREMAKLKLSKENVAAGDRLQVCVRIGLGCMMSEAM